MAYDHVKSSQEIAEIIGYMRRGMRLYEELHPAMDKAKQMLALTDWMVVEISQVPSREGRTELVNMTCEFIRSSIATLEQKGLCAAEAPGAEATAAKVGG